MSKVILCICAMLYCCSGLQAMYTLRYIEGITKDNFDEKSDALFAKMEKRANKLEQEPVTDDRNPPVLLAMQMRNQVEQLKKLKEWIASGKNEDKTKYQLIWYARHDAEIGDLMLSILDEDSTAK